MTSVLKGFWCESYKTCLPFQNKLKSLASKGAPNVISEDTLKGQDSLSTDTGQSCQPEELSGAAGMEQTELADDDLSSSLDNLTVTSLPEAAVVRPNQDYNLVNSLLNLTRSPVSHLYFFPLTWSQLYAFRIEKRNLFLF